MNCRSSRPMTVNEKSERSLMSSAAPLQQSVVDSHSTQISLESNTSIHIYIRSSAHTSFFQPFDRCNRHSFVLPHLEDTQSLFIDPLLLYSLLTSTHSPLSHSHSLFIPYSLVLSLIHHSTSCLTLACNHLSLSLLSLPHICLPVLTLLSFHQQPLLSHHLAIIAFLLYLHYRYHRCLEHSLSQTQLHHWLW